MPETSAPTWHVLQISAALDEELASALAESVPVIGWRPQPSLLRGILALPPKQPAQVRSARLEFRSFTQMSGYARPLISRVARLGPRLCKTLLAQSKHPTSDVLLCTTPFFAPVAERWPGPVAYWLTDRIASYASARGLDVPALDRRLCAAADVVFPNSKRLREYLQTEAACDPQKICILPNAARVTSLLPEPLLAPATLPQDAADLQRPIAGVLGNMGSNVDWVLVREVVRATPWLTWLFVGPVGNDVEDAAQRQARQDVQDAPTTRFTGAKPYGELVHYARGIDVAVLPYLRREPTLSGSSTRFYEHLAACRPMLATCGFAELLEKPPLLQLAETSAAMIAALQVLRAAEFRDGREVLRWEESRTNTWQVRAKTMQAALADRLHAEAANV